MKLQEVRECLMQAFKEKNSIVTPQQLSYTPYSIPLVQAHGVLKHLVDEGAVTKDDRTFTLVDEKKALSVFGMDAPAEPKPEKVSKPTPVVSGRNTSQYVFEKVKRSKGRTVLAVIQAYVRDNKDVTYKQLLTVFPPQVKRFGTINILSAAKEISPDPKRPRYFFKDEDVISLKNQKVVVTNQWTHSAFLEFVVLVKELGYKISQK